MKGFSIDSLPGNSIVMQRWSTDLRTTPVFTKELVRLSPPLAERFDPFHCGMPAQMQRHA